MRIGLEEMLRFSKLFFPRTRTRTFFESCGVAELIVSSYGGRTRRCAEAFARAARAGRPRAWAALEKELLHGQKLPTMERLQEVMEVSRVLAQASRINACLPTNTHACSPALPRKWQRTFGAGVSKTRQRTSRRRWRAEGR